MCIIGIAIGRRLTPFLREIFEPGVAELFVLGALGGAIGRGICLEDRGLPLGAAAHIGLIIADAVVGPALITGEAGRRREVRQPAFFIVLPPAAVGKVEEPGLVRTRAGGSNRGVFHFLHFVTFGQSERPADGFIVAGAQGVDGHSPIEG